MKPVLVAMAAIVVGLLTAGPVAAAPAGMTLVFQRTWGAPDASAAGLAIGPDGSVYTVALLIRGEPPYAQGNVSLLRWSAEGDLLWQKEWGTIGDETPQAVAVSADGAAYVTGTFGGFSAFLVKFDSDGNLVWQRTWGGEREESGNAVAIAPDGSVYVAGVTQSFGSFFGSAAFLLKFRPDGALVWQRTWQAPGGTIAEDVAVSADGAVYLAGNHGFDAGTRPFLAKFTTDGDLIWDRTFIPPGFVGRDTAVFRGIGATPDGGVVAVGRWMPTFDEEVLVVRYSADGGLLWARDWGGDSHEEGIDATVAPDGTAYVVGRTDTFADGPYEDVFVLKVLADGRARDARVWGGGNRDLGEGIALGPNGDLYVAASASIPPYTFRSAPSQMSRVRGAAADADAVVETPAGTLGTPAGTVSALDGTVGTDGASDAVLLRVRPA